MHLADLPSRGCSASYVNASRWWDGPEWLYLSPEEWSKEDFSADEKEVALEKKKKIVSSLINLNASDLVLTCFSSYCKTIRFVAWICRIVYNCKHQNKEKDEITVSEINEAQNLLIRLIQCESFHGIEDNGSQVLIHSLIMGSSELKRLYFKEMIHLNSELLLFCQVIILLEEVCKNVNPPALPLPGDRVQDTSVFQITGIDYAGPILLREYQKAWICLFTCAVYRCVHLEMVTSLTTDTFLQAFHHFVARHGKPSIIYTDNGTNIIRACNAIASIDFNKVSRQGADERIIWKFILPEPRGGVAGTDGESRRVRVKVQNGEVIREIQNLYPLELSSTEELPSKFNQNCRYENISPEQTPFDDAPVKSDGTIPADIKLPTITKSGSTVRIPRRLDL
ncbi:hypothetical protein AVEN_227563-1 [Araneus ventricosus]|uniref:Integrase catalytic domain-containing protein n=1 Tax=Araneus ventricosus TaxID=182803 RepID=A0A4Y2C5L3_ARAVE|nr:hypothetical protein AVEN_227563-1 [Araneus ventricosus]